MRASQRYACPLRDAKDASAYGATWNRDPVSQLLVLLATISPTIRDEREGGSGYKRASSPIIYTPGRFIFQRPNSISSSPSPQRHFHSSSLQQQSSHGRIRY